MCPSGFRKREWKEVRGVCSILAIGSLGNELPVDRQLVSRPCNYKPARFLERPCPVSRVSYHRVVLLEPCTFLIITIAINASRTVPQADNHLEKCVAPFCYSRTSSSFWFSRGFSHFRRLVTDQFIVYMNVR